MSTVLIVEDERAIREGLTKAVERSGHRVTGASGLAEAREAIAKQPPDCILLDLRLRDGDGLDLLREIQREVPVIVATAYGDSDRTIAAMRDGAFEYVTKPFDLPALLATIDRALKQREVSKSTPVVPPSSKGAPATLVGSSAAMLAIWKVIGRAAATDAPVLVTGETGTGKEIVARAIHGYSPRASAPFVPVNLAALPGTLIETELFGHEKGAFTGAFARRVGRFEAAQAGTLFLDEIGDLDAGLQTKLLRVLQDGEFERVGGNERLVAKTRVIAATHKPVRPGEPNAAIRDDLYYRLAVLEIEVPPLRARRSDIPLLVAHALQGTRARAVSEDAMELLLAYDWPGNVRELFHVVHRAAAMCSGEVIDAAALPPQLRSENAKRRRSLDGLALKDALATVEKDLIEAALRRANGNRSEAARQLGISRPYLYDKIEEYGLGEKKTPPP